MTAACLSPTEIAGYSSHETVSPSPAEIVLLSSLVFANSGDAVAVAVLMIWTPSTFACVSVWIPVQEIASSVGQSVLEARESTTTETKQWVRARELGL